MQSEENEGRSSDDNWSGYKSNEDDDVKDTNTDDESPLAKIARLMRGNEFKPLAGGKIMLEKGQVFDNVDHFREILRDYVIQEGFTIERIKNEKARVTCKCANPICPWRIHASPMPDEVTYKIKSYNGQHTCIRETKNVEATSSWIAKKFEDAVRSNPEIKIDVLMEELRKKFGVQCNRQRLYRAKRKALDKINGDHAACYQFLYRYGNMVKINNPGAIALVKATKPVISKNPHFQRFFLSFPTQRQGYLEGCRPFIGLDGCHLKGPFGGALLSAVALDANSGLFPIAVCICEGETTETWGWFLSLLHEQVGEGESKTISFMTDRQKGVLRALAQHFPYDNNRFCARHIYANFKGKYPGLKLRGLFWAAARATQVQQFNALMEQIKGVSEQAYSWLMQVPPCHWSRHAFDETIKNDHITNNMTESFNSQLGAYRQKPILTLLEHIRRKVMKRLQKRYQKCNNWPTEIPPRVQERLEKNQKDGRHIQVIWAGGEEYEVLEETMVLIVNMQQMSCQCRAWQISGIPCKHAMACINHKRIDPTPFIHQFLSKEAYLKTYSCMIHPIPDQTMWPEAYARKT